MMMRRFFLAAAVASAIALGDPLVAVAESTAPLPQSAVRSLGDASDAPFTGTGSASIDAIMKGLYAQFANGLLLRQAGVSVGPGAPLYTTDANNAAYQGVAVLTPGAAAIAAGRSIGFTCTTSGTVTLTLADGSTITLGIIVSAGFQILPFSVVSITLGTAAGTFWNLK